MLRQHNFYDFRIGFSHAIGCQTADIADGIFHTFCDDTVTAAELLIFSVKKTDFLKNNV